MHADLQTLLRPDLRPPFSAALGRKAAVPVAGLDRLVVILAV